MSKIFFTSDTHLGHKNILHLGVGRPFETIEEHDAFIGEKWNSVVSPEDTVFHLGDVALGPMAELPDRLGFLGGLNGEKFLIPGNHDQVASTFSKNRAARFLPMYEEVFKEVLPEKFFLDKSLTCGLKVLLCHYPLIEATGHHEGDTELKKDRYEKLRPVEGEQDLIIHGHTHQGHNLSLTPGNTPQLHVGVDSNDFTPVEVDFSEFL